MAERDRYLSRTAIQPNPAPTFQNDSRLMIETSRRLQGVADIALDEENRVALNDAIEQGSNAGMQRDENGMLSWTPSSQRSSLAIAYNNAGAASFVAQFKTDIGAKANDLAAKYINDPVAFKTAWFGTDETDALDAPTGRRLPGYAETILAGVPEKAKPEIAVELARVGGTAFNSLAHAKAAKDVKDIEVNLTERNKEIVDRLRVAHELGNEGIASKNIIAEKRELESNTEALVRGGMWTPVQRETYLRNVDASLRSAVVVGGAVRLYKNTSMNGVESGLAFARAIDFIDKAVESDASMSPEQRAATRGMAAQRISDAYNQEVRVVNDNINNEKLQIARWTANGNLNALKELQGKLISKQVYPAGPQSELLNLLTGTAKSVEAVNESYLVSYAKNLVQEGHDIAPLVEHWVGGGKMSPKIGLELRAVNTGELFRREAARLTSAQQFDESAVNSITNYLKTNPTTPAVWEYVKKISEGVSPLAAARINQVAVDYANGPEAASLMKGLSQINENSKNANNFTLVKPDDAENAYAHLKATGQLTTDLSTLDGGAGFMSFMTNTGVITKEMVANLKSAMVNLSSEKDGPVIYKNLQGIAGKVQAIMASNNVQGAQVIAPLLKDNLFIEMLPLFGKNRDAFLKDLEAVAKAKHPNNSFLSEKWKQDFTPAVVKELAQERGVRSQQSMIGAILADLPVVSGLRRMVAGKTVEDIPPEMMADFAAALERRSARYYSGASKEAIADEAWTEIVGLYKWGVTDVIRSRDTLNADPGSIGGPSRSWAKFAPESAFPKTSPQSMIDIGIDHAEKALPVMGDLSGSFPMRRKHIENMFAKGELFFVPHSSNAQYPDSPAYEIWMVNKSGAFEQVRNNSGKGVVFSPTGQSNLEKLQVAERDLLTRAMFNGDERTAAAFNEIKAVLYGTLQDARIYIRDSGHILYLDKPSDQNYEDFTREVAKGEHGPRDLVWHGINAIRQVQNLLPLPDVGLTADAEAFYRSDTYQKFLLPMYAFMNGLFFGEAKAWRAVGDGLGISGQIDQHEPSEEVINRMSAHQRQQASQLFNSMDESERAAANLALLLLMNKHLMAQGKHPAPQPSVGPE